MLTSTRKLLLAIPVAMVLAGVLVGCGTNTSAEQKNCVGAVGCTKGHKVAVNGQSCVGASESNVNAWVKARQEDIPAGISLQHVENAAYSICSAAKTEKRGQAYDNELLAVAIRNATGPP